MGGFEPLPFLLFSVF